mmetsp:Transcript_8346/g.21538  ORF Transcript_8346/g.21538 Transcript_8346/m.21538 type:complete len:558 (-) Transcript_8346:99-1772(-)
MNNLGAAKLKVQMDGRQIIGLLALAHGARASAVPATHVQYAAFNWRTQWYPVAWARDCPMGAPFRATLLDEDYAVVLREGDAPPMAFRDRCPHRLASLSEGRLTKQGWIQCSYHGFAFDGGTGECRAIPQLLGTSPRAPLCADAVACARVGGLVWINPGADPVDPPDVPPDVPELVDPSFDCMQTVRDIPVDSTLLAENIMCADHGRWCHHLPAFDMYAASKGRPQEVTVVTEPRITLTARVDAQLSATATAGLTAQTQFSPPCTIVSGRRDKRGDSGFVQAFWVVPVGVGRSRLLSAQLVRKPAPGAPHAPRAPPWRPRAWLQQRAMSRRWVRQCLQNDFLDEDSYLIATQQPRVLAAELAAHEAARTPRTSVTTEDVVDCQDGSAPPSPTSPAFVRRRLYQYRTPSEPLLVELGRFFDAAVPNMPHRYERPELLRAPCPPREIVLDRWSQHTAICPESAAVARRANAVALASRVLLGTLALSLACVRPSVRWAPANLAAAVVLASVWRRASQIVARFHFVQCAERHRAHLARIPERVLADEHLVAVEAPADPPDG